MKQSLESIFDGASPAELDQFDCELAAPKLTADTMNSIKGKALSKAGLKPAKPRRIWLRVAAAAACLALVAGFIVADTSTNQGRIIKTRQAVRTTYRPAATDIASEDMHILSKYGNLSSNGAGSNPGCALISVSGFFVTAKLVEVLPDTYTFFTDDDQYEFRLLKFRTVKLLRGQEMASEFYFAVPMPLMTDYTRYSSFVIYNMVQRCHESAVVYNKTNDSAERLDLVIFSSEPFYWMSENFMAFNWLGILDEGLWDSTEEWLEQTTHRSDAPRTVFQAEERVRRRNTNSSCICVQTLDPFAADVPEMLEKVTDFENGIFVEISGPSTLGVNGNPSFIRYINGFATNEVVTFYMKEYTGEATATCKVSKNVFDANDLLNLPDLAGAADSVAAKVESGDIAPPHIVGYEDMRLIKRKVYAKYAKTDEGIVGIVHVFFKYSCKTETQGTRFCYDDAYFIIESGMSECTPIDRDDLLEKFDSDDNVYIFDGEYDEYGEKYVLVFA